MYHALRIVQHDLPPLLSSDDNVCQELQTALWTEYIRSETINALIIHFEHSVSTQTS